MPVMRWDPFTALARLDDEFDSVVRRTFGTAAHQFVPPVEMATDGADVLITLEVPGVDPADVDIEVADRLLTVSGERKDRWEDRRGKMLVREVRYGAFRRTFQLPDGVTADQVEAESDNGMLRLRIRNVTKPVLPPQKVTVRAADAGQQRKTIEATPPKQS
ncbi:Hsp20/alpha crystallin family protein [Dactylosporangium sp. NBC_01737]|uniref:Hsp20/alpha crystallin family protein n=1 Tax=Dactylosporangium sp. NBC_01737 TaxID=2975959 RepID=UPI002E12FB8C|nr:Hsp20/alpha crystallin family protein [Dactylosporangium sp. NBC_01737]